MLNDIPAMAYSAGTNVMLQRHTTASIRAAMQPVLTIRKVMARFLLIHPCVKYFPYTMKH